jgi:hypothetical protein
MVACRAASLSLGRTKRATEYLRLGAMKDMIEELEKEKEKFKLNQRGRKNEK